MRFAEVVLDLLTTARIPDAVAEGSGSQKGAAQVGVIADMLRRYDSPDFGACSA